MGAKSRRRLPPFVSARGDQAARARSRTRVRARTPRAQRVDRAGRRRRARVHRERARSPEHTLQEERDRGGGRGALRADALDRRDQSGAPAAHTCAHTDVHAGRRPDQPRAAEQGVQGDDQESQARF